MGPNDSPRRVDVRGAAQHTGFSVRSFRYWRESGGGPPSYVVGRKLYYDLDELDAWVARRKAATLRGDQVVAP